MLLAVGGSIASAADRTSSSNQRQITGEITNLSTVTNEQTGQRQVLAQIRTSDGNRVLVDLGNPNNLRQAELEQGQEITVSGRHGQVDGQSGFLANRLEDENGEVVQIVRGGQQGQPLQQQDQQGEQQWRTQQFQRGTGGMERYSPQQGEESQRQQSSGQAAGQEWESADDWQGQAPQRTEVWGDQPPQIGWQDQRSQQGMQEQPPRQYQQGSQGQPSRQDQQDWQRQQGRQQGQLSWQTQQQGQARWLQDQGTGGSRGEQPRMAGLLVTGQLTDTRELQVQGQNQPFVLAKVVTPEGRTVIANLGPRNRLPQNLRLQRGEQVAVSGELGLINNQPVIVARTFANVVDLGSQWTGLSQQGQQRQQTSQRQQDTSWQTDEMDQEEVD
jgi:hypothetical protein